MNTFVARLITTRMGGMESTVPRCSPGVLAPSLAPAFP